MHSTYEAECQQCKVNIDVYWYTLPFYGECLFCCRNHRCFTFGIGSGASSALVEGLARAGNGTAEFVKEGERMQPKVSYYFVFYEILMLYHVPLAVVF